MPRRYQIGLDWEANTANTTSLKTSLRHPYCTIKCNKNGKNNGERICLPSVNGTKVGEKP